MRRALVALALAAAAGARAAHAQVSSCQAVFGEREVTAAFARAGADVSHALSGRVVAAADEAGLLLERCLAAEMAGAPDADTCRRAGARLRDAREGLDALDAALVRLQAVSRQDRTLPVFDDTLAHLLADGPGRVTRVPGARAGEAAPPALRGLADVLDAQRAGAAPVRAAFDAALEAFPPAMPAAEKGRLAASVYAERAALLDRVLEATARLEAYRRFHFDTCRATAAALRQVYPAGLQWLDEPR